MLKDIHLALAGREEARVKLPALRNRRGGVRNAAEEGTRNLDYAATLTCSRNGPEWSEGRGLTKFDYRTVCVILRPRRRVSILATSYQIAPGPFIGRSARGIPPLSPRLSACGAAIAL